MNLIAKGTFTALIIISISLAQNRERIGVGYDEGLSGRFFFTDRIGIQAGIGFERLGGYDETPNNGEKQNPEYNMSFGLGGIANIVQNEWVYLDALVQAVFAHDGTRQDEDIDERNWIFIRCALAPEILLNDCLGLGMRFGIELVNMSDTRVRDAGEIHDSDDGVTNIRFYGPRNPFNGAVLGLSVYYYFGGMAY